MLVHGISRVVTAVLLRAAQDTYFNVIVTEGRPNKAIRYPFKSCSSATKNVVMQFCNVIKCIFMFYSLCSIEYAQSLMQAGIPVRMVADSSVGFYMESVNMCVVGAEGVMENGGIINKIGTFQIALVAHALQKPFYVAVESYKFARMYPLSQRDMMSMIHSEPQEVQHSEECSHIVDDIAVESPNVDFTPGKLITLLFTDIGVLTPAAVSDELIRLYQ